MNYVCEHIHNTNFIVLSPFSRVVWLFLICRFNGRDPVDIHPGALPRLAGLTEEQGEDALVELQSMGFYDNPPFLTIVETKGRIGSLPAAWNCSCCAPNRWIDPKTREEVLLIGECAHCGSTDRLEVDHIHPVSRGGKNDRWNLQVLCKICNIRKGNRFIG